MTHARITLLLNHLALAASGLCLAVVAMPLLPEMPFLLLGYLLLISWSWRLGGRSKLPIWAANLFALAIAGGAVGYLVLRVHSEYAFEWARDVPTQVAVIPLLAPILMLLLLVRLFRSRKPQDMLHLHGVALLQVALACVLASGTLFGFLLTAYFVIALCALAANESRRRQRESPLVEDFTPPVATRGRWLRFGLVWLLVVMLVAVPLFLLTPRLDGPNWEPLSRIGNPRSRAAGAKTGFSDEIDLQRVGTLTNDDSVAFTFEVTDLVGNPRTRLPSDQRWRGGVLDRYETGVWRSELTSFSAATIFQTGTPRRPAGQDQSRIHFDLQEKTTALFLAEPIHPEPTPGSLPIAVIEPDRQRPSLFFETGGTVLSTTYLPHSKYRYTQDVSTEASRTRYPAVRVSDLYQIRLLRCGAPGMSDLTARLLLQLVEDEPLRQAIRERHPEKGGRDPLPAQFESLPPGTWFRICKLLEDHLARSGSFTYEMASSRSDLSLDPTVDFLENVRRGSCERYASGLTLMLRSVGIPARIVKGYRGWDTEAGRYVVRQRHAHAWVEAMVPAEGPGPLRMEWVTLDPTPSLEEPTGSAIARWWEQGRRSGRSFWEEMILGYGSRRQAVLWETLSPKNLIGVGAVALLAAALPALFWLIRRRRARRSLGPTTFGVTLFARLRAALVARFVLPFEPGQTPAEFAELVRPLLADHPATSDLADLPRRVVESYYRERFGLILADPSEVAVLSAEVDRLRTIPARS